MYKCNNCEAKFEFPDERQICFEEYYGVSHLMDGRTYINTYMCPECGDDDMEELEQCNLCGEWFNELHDTTEMINGGCGYVCEQCLEDGDIGG